MPASREVLASIDVGSPTGLAPEPRLLLAVAGGDGSDELIRQLAAGPLTWDQLLVLTAQERAEAVVSARLHRLGITPPDHVREVLQGLAIRSDLRMAMLDRRLDQTITALDAAGIPVMLLKGSALGRTVYGSLPRRPMLDLDLLVPANQAAGAREVALANGWALGEMEEKSAFYEGHYHLPPLHDALGRNFNLEIHTALFPERHPFVWPVEQLWTESRVLPGQKARIPALEDLLLHVGLHFMWSHAGQFGPWRSFRDVRVMAEDPTLDWDRFTRKARATRAATSVYWTLRLARLLTGAAIPPAVEQALAPSLPESARAMLDRHFTGQWFSPEGNCPSRRLERWLWQLAIQPRPSGHGATRPWDRQVLFRPSGAFTAPRGAGYKLLHHLGSPGRYLNYFRRIAWGTGR